MEERCVRCVCFTCTKIRCKSDMCPDDPDREERCVKKICANADDSQKER